MPQPTKLLRLNQAIISGYLGKDPHVEGTIVFFSVACRESWMDKETNQWKDRTNWIPVSCFGKAAEQALKLGLRKGSPVAVWGRLTSYASKDKRTMLSLNAERIQNLGIVENYTQGPPPRDVDEDRDYGMEKDQLDDIPC